MDLLMCRYLAPEYFQHGKISDKTDVYALGVVLLELVTGRKPIETRKGTGEENLISWVGQQFTTLFLKPFVRRILKVHYIIAVLLIHCHMDLNILI